LPEAKRVDILQRLDGARKTTDVQLRIVLGIINAMSSGLGAQMPSDLDTQSAAFKDKIRPVLANNTLTHNLQSAILAVAAERAARAGEDIKAKTTQVAK
jgi:hypothetical protein